MNKFGRNYTLEVQTKLGNTLIIELPFTITFDITRNTLTSANVCQIRIYNLNKDNRNQLRFDISDYGTLRNIKLKAGYGKNIPVIFSGNISQAWSVREGNNFITQIECFDGGHALVNSTYNKQFISGTPLKTILEDMMSNMGNVKKGVVGNIEGDITRGNSFSGDTGKLVSELAPGKFFIDNEKSYILGDSECLEGELEVINSESGLLGTPIREETIINFEMLFEPRLKIGQVIRLESSTDESFNSSYKIISLKHRGTISESVAGNATTSVGMYKGATALEVVE